MVKVVKTVRTVGEEATIINDINRQLYNLAKEAKNVPIVNRKGQKNRIECYASIYDLISRLEDSTILIVEAFINQVFRDTANLELVVKKQPGYFKEESINVIRQAQRIMHSIESNKSYFGENARNLRTLRRHAESAANILSGVERKIGSISSMAKAEEKRHAQEQKPNIRQVEPEELFRRRHSKANIKRVSSTYNEKKIPP